MIKVTDVDLTGVDLFDTGDLMMVFAGGVLIGAGVATAVFLLRLHDIRTQRADAAADRAKAAEILATYTKRRDADWVPAARADTQQIPKLYTTQPPQLPPAVDRDWTTGELEKVVDHPDPDDATDPWGGPATTPPTTDEVAARLAEQLFPTRPGCGDTDCRGCRQCGWDLPDLVDPDDQPPVTAADLAPIGPDHMPAVTWRGWTLVAIVSVPVVTLLILAAIAALVWLAWDWYTTRRRTRKQARILAGLLALAAAEQRPAPGRHRAKASA